MGSVLYPLNLALQPVKPAVTQCAVIHHIKKKTCFAVADGQDFPVMLSSGTNELDWVNVPRKAYSNPL